MTLSQKRLIATTLLKDANSIFTMNNGEAKIEQSLPMGLISENLVDDIIHTLTTKK